MTNSQSADNYQMISSCNNLFKPGSDPINIRGNALSNSSKENQNPLILSGTKPQPFNQSLRTNNAEYLSRNPLKTINANLNCNIVIYVNRPGNSASRSPLTPLSKNIEFSQNLKSTVKPGSYPINLSGNALSDSSKENQSPIIPSTISSLSRSSIEHRQAFSGIENRYIKHTELQDINVELCKEQISGDLPLCSEDLGKQSLRTLYTTKAVPVVGNYQSSDNDRLATGQMLMSTLHEVQVDSNFQPSFEKLGTGGYCLNTKPNAKPNLKQPGEQRNMAAPKATQSAKSTVTFALPASTIFKRPQVTLGSSSDIVVKQQSKKTCCKISPGSSAYDTSSVKCYYEQGESSGSKNLLGEFNNVEDCDSSDSDCDCDDVDVHDFDNTVTKWSEYLDVGDPDRICSKCQAIMWNHERNNKSATKKPPTFSLCCKNGQIILEKEKQPPEPLASLLTGGSRFRHFKENIRIYNCIFSMSSTGGQIDRSINRGGAPYCFKVKGVDYHSMGSFVPLDGEIPKSCQLYIYDTEDEVHNIINVVKGGRDAVDEDIVQSLLEILDKHNHLVKGFRMACERISQNAVNEFRLVLISSSSASGRPNHIGPSNEVVGLIVTDEYAKGCRDTIIHSRTNGLERIFETDPRFMQLQYPILFPHGDIGYYRQIPLNRPNQKNQKQRQNTENEDSDEKGEREFITMKEYYNYKLMIRPSEGLTPRLGGRLWQQYVVDAFTAIEQYRLDWIRGHQTTIHSDMYHNIRDALNKGDNNPENVGKATNLPASFIGSKRYMNQYFKDAMTICRTLGHPSLFLTMTTNTKWPEIQRMLKFLPGVDVVDAPDVVARVFKMKVDQLLNQIKNKNYFGRCIGEIPDPSIDPVDYEAVKNYMIHGPCGTDCVKSPCMVKGRCIKHFPKRYNSHSYFDDYGFPIYKRRKTGITRKRGDVIGRLAEVHSSINELLYLRMLLLSIKGAVCFDDLKTVNDHVYNSFHEACAALGILQNDQQWHEAIGENAHTSMPPQLRAMFVNILVYSPISHPRSLWEAHWGCMSDDILLVRRNEENTHKKSYLLNDEQKIVYDSILDNINQKKGGVFFVYGSGGCGKTFLWQTLCCRLRSEHKIMLHVASCGIAAVLLPGGRTAHSRFHIPLKLDENCSAGLRHGTDISELLQRTDLIIWHEAPIQHRHAFECVDRSLRDIMSAIDKSRAKKPFGGITIFFGGDFRQILPVIPKASRAEVVCSTLNKSKLWESCDVFLLKQNMQLNAGNSDLENKTIADFSKWQLAVGDDRETNISPRPDTGEMLIKIPDQYIVHTSGDPIQKLFEVTYPDFIQNISSHEYLRSRAILTPTNIVVD
ncbi:uncharacterized protein LOC141695404 [Apium graveolens]|uniref:uncharacterized protein LOC141695404 n=1 Tax=Apium graveolens TaxID=4045 RepID=UPI003D79AD19